jgi:hypothetical protein
MVARLVRRQLKPHRVAAFTRTREHHLIPLLRTQPGFQDEGSVAIALISLVHNTLTCF